MLESRKHNDKQRVTVDHACRECLPANQIYIHIHANQKLGILDQQEWTARFVPAPCLWNRFREARRGACLAAQPLTIHPLSFLPEESMTRLSIPLVLILLVPLTVGCETETPSSADQNSSAEDSATESAGRGDVPTPEGSAVSEEEQASLDTLRDRGAKIDVDDAGHVRLVELVDTAATDDDLKLLSHFPRLESVDISDGEITAAGLVHLKELQGVKRLYLTNLPVTSDALAHVSHLQNLDTLSLRNTPIDNEAMVHIKQFEQLNVLNLADTDITNAALKELQGLQHLGTLVLAGTAVTGEGFAHLDPIKTLRTLNVNGCTEIDGHLLKLDDLPELRMLYVHGCSVSEEEVEELTDRNSQLAVFGD